MKIPDTLPWRIDPDDRPDMQWNNHIVEVDRPYMTICFMTYDGTEENLEGEVNAQYIVHACNNYPKLKKERNELIEVLREVSIDPTDLTLDLFDRIDELLNRIKNNGI